MHQYGKISVIVGLCLAALVFSLLSGLPSRTLELRAFGLARSILIPGPWFLGLLLAAITVVGGDNIVHTHPVAPDAGLGYTLTFWPLPGMITLLTVPFLHTWHEPLHWGIGVLLFAILLPAVLIAQYSTVDLEAPTRRIARWFLNLLAYGLVFLLYMSVHRLRFPGLSVVIAVALVSGAMSLEILRWSWDNTGQTWFYALLTGLVMGEIAWALTYWPVNGLLGSLYLFWPFYLFTSVIYQHLGGRLTRAAIIEFVALGLVGFGALWYYTP